MNTTPAHPELRNRRGDYGFDASTQGLLPVGLGGLLAAGLAARLVRRSRAVALLASGASLALLSTFAVYLHTTRRGKFAVWEELLDGLPLRGDERVLDVGCGRGAVLAMVAKLVPDGHATGLDLLDERPVRQSPRGDPPQPGAGGRERPLRDPHRRHAGHALPGRQLRPGGQQYGHPQHR